MNSFIKTLQEIKGFLGLDCHGNMDASNLIAAAEVASKEKLFAISTVAEYVHMLWSWMEKTGVEIYAKITEDFKNQTMEEYGERLSERVASAFKAGASGVQIMTTKEDLDFLVSSLYPVKDDLFFGRQLFFGLELNKIEPFDWEDIFYRVNKIGASGILFEKGTMDKKKKGADDTVGRLYGLFDLLGGGFSGQIHFSGFNITDIEAAVRLCQKMRPELFQKLRFFLDQDFFKIG